VTKGLKKHTGGRGGTGVKDREGGSGGAYWKNWEGDCETKTLKFGEGRYGGRGKQN